MVWERIFHSTPFNPSNLVILRRVQTDTVKICHTNHRRVGTAHQPVVLGYLVLSVYHVTLDIAQDLLSHSLSTRLILWIEERDSD